MKQIIVLRKLQIPVKDIITIFKSENTAALIQAFVDKLESLYTEITALSELRRLVDEFLHKMLINGIKKISAITLLYEEKERSKMIEEILPWDIANRFNRNQQDVFIPIRLKTEA